MSRNINRIFNDSRIQESEFRMARMQASNMLLTASTRRVGSETCPDASGAHFNPHLIL
jgi:hypothetical protein